jgi:hypothetical protein
VAHLIGRRRVLAGAGAAIPVGTLEGCGAPALFGDDTTVPDRTEAELAVSTIAA